MKAARQSSRNHWLLVGKWAHRHGRPLEAVLTINEGVNVIIRDGYDEEKRRVDRVKAKVSA